MVDLSIVLLVYQRVHVWKLQLQSISANRLPMKQFAFSLRAFTAYSHLIIVAELLPWLPWPWLLKSTFALIGEKKISWGSFLQLENRSILQIELSWIIHHYLHNFTCTNCDSYYIPIIIPIMSMGNSGPYVIFPKSGPSIGLTSGRYLQFI